MNVDKGKCAAYTLHKNIFKLRNQAAHLNYNPLSYDKFQGLVSDIISNLKSLASEFYVYIDKLISNQITPLIELFCRTK